MLRDKTEGNTMNKTHITTGQDTAIDVSSTTSLKQLEDGLFTIRYDDYGFQELTRI